MAGGISRARLGGRCAARVALLLLAAGLSLIAQRTSTKRSENQPVPPFRIIGNIYYVGVSGVTSFLITTPQGHILLDGGFPETAPLIETSIAKLGFRVRDVKILLNSHAHFDHSGGLADLKRVTGASLVASRADREVLESGGQVSFEGWKHASFPAVIVDRLIGDRETVQLGDVKLTALLTPGHTKGCTTWTMPATDSGKTYHVVFFCSTSVPGYRLIANSKYPQMVSDYERTFARLRQIPCDVFLAPHGSFFHLDEKRARLAKGGANPFIDPAEFRTFLDNSERDFERELARQRTEVSK